MILRVDPALPTLIKFVRQYKARKVIYDVEMFTAGASQAIRDAFGLFWRKKSGKRLPPDLKGVAFSNATTFSTRVRLRLLKEMCRRHQLANPTLSCYVTSYLARPELKIRDHRGMVTSLTYTQGVQQLPQHLTLPFLRDLYQYARTNLPEKEVVERFLVLNHDLLLGSLPEQLSMSVDEIPTSQDESLPQAVIPTTQISGQNNMSAPSYSSPNQMSLPFQQPVSVGSSSQSSQFLHSLPNSVVEPQSSQVAYTSIASLPQTATGVQTAIYSAPPPLPQSSTPAHYQQTSSSPTYAILTPVQVSPPGPASGSFLNSVPSSGLESGTSDDPLSKRNRHQFAQKSTPYPAQS